MAGKMHGGDASWGSRLDRPLLTSGLALPTMAFVRRSIGQITRMYTGNQAVVYCVSVGRYSRLSSHRALREEEKIMKRGWGQQPSYHYLATRKAGHYSWLGLAMQSDIKDGNRETGQSE
ncbi:hypothetical protein An18g01940 [Aspergillus niger]|uniref:Uncharacterized protein n=2 Tax=Aspergillus niger TaxID=5061 RepID=A2RA51_ASPNC|nr:hypothetical protein An18g01940 [Aspergillus niger]CAK47266.1 hypothetical protein An18g01940 [Aspergillus niger]